MNITKTRTGGGKKGAAGKTGEMAGRRSGTAVRALALCAGCLLFFAACPAAALAASGTGAITSSFKSIYNIIAAIVTSIGQLYLLWGVFEWATSLNAQDGTTQSMAFKRIAAGLVACMAPTIITMISY